MVWHRSVQLARVAKSLSQFEAQTAQQARVSSLWSAITSNRAASRAFSTSTSSPAEIEQSLPSNPAPAAPPIDFANSKAVPARILPASPSYFTGSPRFTDHYLNLDSLRARYASLPTLNPSEANSTQWLRLGAVRNALDELIPQAKYHKLQKLLDRLNLIRPEVMPAEVRAALDFFTQPLDTQKVERAPKVPDEMGRAFAVGKRKTSSARVWLVEGDGQVLVNDRNIVDLFPRLHTRESALWPLTITERINKYNVWALVRGGGVTGQAEAMTVALAKALIIHEPALKPILRRAGCVTTDPRQVERKKPGHLKARKKPAWVKR